METKLIISLFIEYKDTEDIDLLEFEDATVEEVKEYAEKIKAENSNILCMEVKESYEKIRKKRKPIKNNRSGTNKLNKWRNYVLERDEHKCQLCNSKENLHVHHIKKYADYENLQTDVNNGITLCEECHRKTYNKEEKFETIFIRIILNKILVNFGIEDINDIIDKNN